MFIKMGTNINISKSSSSGINGSIAPKSGDAVTTLLSFSAPLSSTALAANRIYVIPFNPNKTFTCQNLYIDAATSSASAEGKILIYSNDNGEPNQLLYESATLSLATTGIKIATTAFTFNAGTTYWICFWGNSAVSIRFYGSATGMQLIGANYTTSPGIYTSFLKSVTWGTSTPNPFGGGLSGSTAAVPFIGITI